MIPSHFSLDYKLCGTELASSKENQPPSQPLFLHSGHFSALRGSLLQAVPQTSTVPATLSPQRPPDIPDPSRTVRRDPSNPQTEQSKLQHPAAAGTQPVHKATATGKLLYHSQTPPQPGRGSRKSKGDPQGEMRDLMQQPS